MTIFHIKYPRRRGFLKWDELGCLARALGFQVKLFRDSATDEISVENDGMYIKEVMKMLEYRLLHKGLHHTVNMHTAEWNMAAMRKSMMLLAHKALTFEEIHNIRVAYQLYEAGDMKGMNLDKHTLLRSLKMCGRTIAPLKLMHRIKHMKEDFREVGRIQLSEYFDLILWCDLYRGFSPREMEYPDGKENKLFKLVDFEKLLSHHDERVAWALNRQYLREEWDFGQESLGSKEMFKEPPITNESRIHQLEERNLSDEYIEGSEVATKLHKRKYRHLKHELGTSQKRVYRAHAGYIRDRPITAPDLSMYHPKAAEEKVAGTTAQEAYQSVRRRLKSAPPSSRSTSLFEDRPSTQQYQRQSTPQAVTRNDLSDVEKKMSSLKFDMITLDSKYEIEKDEKMDHFLPGYREKLAKRPPPVPPSEPELEPPKQIHWTEEVVEQLVHPTVRLPPSHARRCDARYRGWHPVRIKKGPHFVLVAPSYENSPQGQMFRKLKERTFGPVRHIHKEHLFRYTSPTQVEHGKGRLAEERPFTAPARMQAYRARTGSARASSSASSSLRNGQYASPPAIEISRVPRVQDDDTDPGGHPRGRTADPRGHTADPRVQNEDKEWDEELRRREEELRRQENDKNILGADFGYESLEEEQNGDLLLTKKNVSESQMEFRRNDKDYNDEGLANMDLLGEVEGFDVEIPVPPMQHSKPKIVEVGHIGTISLLEKIEESQDLEDRYSQTSHKYSEHQDAVSDSGSRGDEMRKNLLSSPSLSVKFNHESQKLFTSTPGPITQTGGPHETSDESGSDFGEGDDDSTVSPITELKSESIKSDTCTRPGSVEDELETKTEEKAEVECLKAESPSASAKQVQIRVESGKERTKDTRARSSSSSSSRLKRRCRTGSFQRNTPMNVDRKYFRLIERVSDSISRDLQIRLLTQNS